MTDAPDRGGRPGDVLPVLRPRLPGADRLLPYLRRIDASRAYTNWGPLVAEFESRVAERLDTSSASVCSAASGTSALVGAIVATAGPASRERPLAIVPAFTFVATALAAELCGYEPYVLDVHPDTWQLDPDVVASHPCLSRVGVVIPVAPYGRAVPQQAWTAFTVRSHVPVVVDGGASFEALEEAPRRYVGEVPVALSFHATKSLSTGEGGCVVTTDPACHRRVVQALNFGFFDARECSHFSTNGKMSEYHAAVGLAELDGWIGKRAELRRVAERYRTAALASGIAGGVITSPGVASCYALYAPGRGDDATAVARRLTAGGIESRLWYGHGLHRQPRFASAQRDDLPVTSQLTSLVGLPVAPDLTGTQIERVLDALGEPLVR